MRTISNIEMEIINVPRDPFYIESSLPEGMTISDYRRLRPRPAPLSARLRTFFGSRLAVTG